MTFYVTPLAKGWLRGERAEVIQNGRKIGKMRTSAKVNTQRKTLLLVLTFLLPWLLYKFFHNELSEEVMQEGFQTPDQSGEGGGAPPWMRSWPRCCRRSRNTRPIIPIT